MEIKQEGVEPKAPVIRQIVIETDGHGVFVKKADVSLIEFKAILEMVYKFLNTPTEQPKQVSPLKATTPVVEPEDLSLPVEDKAI